MFFEITCGILQRKSPQANMRNQMKTAKAFYQGKSSQSRCSHREIHQNTKTSISLFLSLFVFWWKKKEKKVKPKSTQMLATKQLITIQTA